MVNYLDYVTKFVNSFNISVVRYIVTGINKIQSENSRYALISSSIGSWSLSASVSTTSVSAYNKNQIRRSPNNTINFEAYLCACFLSWNLLPCLLWNQTCAWNWDTSQLFQELVSPHLPSELEQAAQHRRFSPSTPRPVQLGPRRQKQAINTKLLFGSLEII